MWDVLPLALCPACLTSGIHFPFKKISTLKKTKVINAMFSHSLQNFLCRKRQCTKPHNCSTHIKGGPELQLQVWVQTEKRGGITVCPWHRRWQRGLFGSLRYAGCCDRIWYQVRLLIVSPSSLLHLTPIKSEIPGFPPDPVCNMKSI